MLLRLFHFLILLLIPTYLHAYDIDELLKADKFYEHYRYDSALFYYEKFALQLEKPVRDTIEVYFLLRLIECNIHVNQLAQAEKRILMIDLSNITDPKCSKRIQSYYYFSLAHIHYEKGNNKESLEFLFKASGSKDTEIEIKISDLIGLNKTILKDYNGASKDFIYSIHLAEKYFPSNDFLLAMIYNDFGSLNYRMNKLDLALTYFVKSIQIKLQYNYKNQNQLIPTLICLGYIYSRNRDFYNALNYYYLAENILEKQNSDNSSLKEQISCSIGSIFFDMEQYEQALLHFNKCKNIDNTFLFCNMVDCKQKLNIPVETLEMNVNKIIDLENSPNSIHAYLKYVCYLQRIGRMDIVLQQFTNIEKVVRELPDTSYQKFLYFIYLGDYHLNKGNADTTLFYTEKILSNEKSKGHNKNNSAFPSTRTSIAIVHRMQGDAYILKASKQYQTYALQSTKEALAAYLNAIDTYDTMKGSFASDESRGLLSAREDSYYKKAIHTALRLYTLTGQEEYKEQAFWLSERCKYTTLVSSVRKKGSLKSQNVPYLLLKQMHDLKDSINRCKEKHRNEATVPDQLALHQMETSYDLLVHQVKEKYSTCGKIWECHQLIEIEQLMASLRPDQAIVDYVWMDTVLVIFFIDNEHFEVTIQRDIASLDGDVETVRAFIATPPNMITPAKEYRNYISSSNRLYKTLLGTFSELKGKKSLIIIPDGKLSYIPFETLLTEQPNGAMVLYNNLPYLILDNPVSYSYSIQLMNVHKRVPDQNQQILAFAPEYIAVKDNNMLKGNVYRNGYNLDALAYNKEEVTEICQYFEGIKACGNSASEQLFYELSGKYSILHFAAHTLIDDNFPMFSKIVLYGNDSIGEDGLLNTYELSELELHSDLVVLSGCQTGSGKLLKGEGISGLATGFIQAGCKSIVATLWSVEDQASKELIIAFYKYLKDGCTKDIALQQAKIEYLTNCDPEKANPHFWAGYICIGDVQTIVQKGNSLRNYLIGVGLIVLVVLGMVLRGRRDRSSKPNV